MTKFKLPKPRYDRKIANEGREIYITDENGTYWGTFTVALVDPLTPKVQIAVEKLKRKYNALKGKSAGVPESIQAEVFVELALLDWKDVGDWRPEAADDAMMPFSKEKALEFFTLCETDEATGEKDYLTAWLLARLSREAEDIGNFQPLDQTDAPEGN